MDFSLPMSFLMLPGLLSSLWQLQAMAAPAYWVKGLPKHYPPTDPRTRALTSIKKYGRLALFQWGFLCCLAWFEFYLSQPHSASITTKTYTVTGPTSQAFSQAQIRLEETSETKDRGFSKTSADITLRVDGNGTSRVLRATRADNRSFLTDLTVEGEGSKQPKLSANEAALASLINLAGTEDTQALDAECRWLLELATHGRTPYPRNYINNTPLFQDIESGDSQFESRWQFHRIWPLMLVAGLAGVMFFSGRYCVRKQLALALQVAETNFPAEAVDTASLAVQERFTHA